MRKILTQLIRLYQLLLSPWVGSSCRFEPTCSNYGLSAMQKHGAAAGSYLTVKRILRCHPWCSGGVDLVPEESPKLFRHLLSNSSKKSML